MRTKMWPDCSLIFHHVNFGCLLCQMLSRLLNSSHPEDLKAANKLIKEMVQEVKLSPAPFINDTFLLYINYAATFLVQCACVFFF